MRSAWRGLARKISMPKRPMSKRGAPVAIISIAQQASPNVAGHTLVLRDQLTIFSTVVSSRPPGIFSSRPMSAPLQAAAAPFVDVRDPDRGEEQRHRDEP